MRRLKWRSEQIQTISKYKFIFDRASSLLPPPSTHYDHNDLHDKTPLDELMCKCQLRQMHAAQMVKSQRTQMGFFVVTQQTRRDFRRDFLLYR